MEGVLKSGWWARISLCIAALVVVHAVNEKSTDGNDQIDQTDEKAVSTAPVFSGGGYFEFPGSSSGDCFKDYPYLRQRFSWEQLEFFCQQKRTFDEVIFGNETARPFTPAQADYLASLRMDLNVTARNSTTAPRLAVRKEIRRLSKQERRMFAWALRALTVVKIDGVSKYDLLVTLHHPALAPGSHVGPAFLPWHREYLRMFETALRLEHPLVVGLPYWDSTLESTLPDPSDSILWHPRFFGNRVGAVAAGPLARKVFNFPDESQPLTLTRNVSNENGGPLTSEDVDLILEAEDYRQFTACIDPRLEKANRRVYEWVGGTMASIYYAPQDFVFFLHHAFLDLAWERFRANQTDAQRRYGYPPNYEACSKFHYGRSPMKPFEPLTNLDGLSDAYGNYYVYEPTPAECATDADCNGDGGRRSDEGYLFCAENKCRSKIRHGGRCTGLQGTNACHASECSARTQSCVHRVSLPNTVTEDSSTEDSKGKDEFLSRIDPETWESIAANLTLASPKKSGEAEKVLKEFSSVSASVTFNVTQNILDAVEANVNDTSVLLDLEGSGF